MSRGKMIHWKRSILKNADDTDVVVLKDCQEPGILLQGVHDPGSILRKLAGLEDVLLPQIVSFLDCSVISCTCCKDRPVVFCFHRGRRVAIDTGGKSLEEYGPPPEAALDKSKSYCWIHESTDCGGEIPQEIPEGLLWNTKPNDILLEGLHVVRHWKTCNHSVALKEMVIPDDVPDHEKPRGIFQHGPAGSPPCFDKYYVVVNQDGFHSSLKCMEHIPWCLAHLYNAHASKSGHLYFEFKSYRYGEYEQRDFTHRLVGYEKRVVYDEHSITFEIGKWRRHQALAIAAMFNLHNKKKQRTDSNENQKEIDWGMLEDETTRQSYLIFLAECGFVDPIELYRPVIEEIE